MMQRVAALDDLWSGELVPVAVGGIKVVLVRIDDAVHAYEDRCAHLGVPISEGVLDGGVLTCRAHQWQYDIATGRGVNPKTACLARFPVEIRAGAIYVDIARRT